MTKKTLFLNGWYFTKQPLGSTLEDIKERKEAFRAVNLPHDWLIYQVRSFMKTLPAGIVRSFPVKRNRTIGMRFILKVSIWIRQCISMDRYWVSGNMDIPVSSLI